MDYCDEFDPAKAAIAGGGSGGWDSFEVPDNEAEHVARPNKDTDLGAVLARAKAARIGRGALLSSLMR